MNGIGVLLVQQGHGADAIPYFDRSIQLAPFEARFNRADALASIGDRAGAIAQVGALLTSLPGSAQFDGERKRAHALLARISS